MSIASLVVQELESKADLKQAAILSRFFKTGPGGYGEGDRFFGLKVPAQRLIAKKYLSDFTLEDADVLLRSVWHECRLIALLSMVELYRKTEDHAYHAQMIGFYEKHFSCINNWDLVDLSAPSLTGDWYAHNERSCLFDWIKSDRVWTRRIAILTSFAFIKQHDFETTLDLSELCLSDSHDLIHKAVGWMLREIGKRDGDCERKWLQTRYKRMPRTMLRYAIERFPKEEYYLWLEGKM